GVHARVRREDAGALRSRGDRRTDRPRPDGRARTAPRGGRPELGTSSTARAGYRRCPLVPSLVTRAWPARSGGSPPGTRGWDVLLPRGPQGGSVEGPR